MDNHFTNYASPAISIDFNCRRTDLITRNISKCILTNLISLTRKFIFKHVLLEVIDLKEIIICTFKSPLVESFHMKKIVIAWSFTRVSLLEIEWV